MGLKLIGAVGVKVRPDAHGFRDEAERDIKREMRGYDDGRAVPVRVRAEFDNDRLKRDFEAHKRNMLRAVRDLNDQVSRERIKPSFDSTATMQMMRDFKKVRDGHREVMSGMEKDMNHFYKRWQKLNRKSSKIPGVVDARRENIKQMRIIESHLQELNNIDAAERNRILREYRNWANSIRAINERLARNNFTDFSRTLQKIRNETLRAQSIMEHVKETHDRVGAHGLVDALKDTTRWSTRAYIEARKFRSEWERLSEDERKALALRVTVEDNGEIEKYRDRIARLRADLAKAPIIDLRSQLEKARKDGSRDLDEFEAEYAARVRRLQRLRSGWELHSDADTKQGADNQRIATEFEASLRRARQKADETRDYIDDLAADIEVTADTGGATAALKWLSRPRVAPIHARVSAKSLAVAEGLLKSLTGYNVVSTLGDKLDDMVRNYDKFTLKWGSIVTAMGTVSNAVVAGVASVASVGKGAVQLLQGLAMAPTVFGAIATTGVVATVALKDFFKALQSGDTSKLTSPVAVANVERLAGTWTKLSNAIKDGFWSQAGTHFADFVLKAMPSLERGMRGTAESLGRVWEKSWTAMAHSLDAGYFDRMFKGLQDGLLESANAVGPLMRAIMQLGARGSEHLPRLGRYVTSVAEGFERWIDAADRSGKIDQWIDNAAQSFQDFVKVGQGAWDVLVGVADAALKAGGPSFTQFADAVQSWGKAMRGVKAQAIMGELFKGAFDGMRRLGPGLGEFFKSLGRNIKWLSRMESAVGGVGGAFFNSLATVFDNRAFKQGTVTALEDMRVALLRLRPAFNSAGTIVGNFGRLSGAVFKGITPAINEITDVVANVSSKLVGPLVEAIPRLTSGAAQLASTLGGIANVGATGLSGLISGFNALPGPIQSAVLATAGLVALRPHLRAFGDSITKRLVPAHTALGREAVALQQAYAAQGRQVSLTTSTWRAFKQEMAATTRLSQSHVSALRAQLREQKAIASSPLVSSQTVRDARVQMAGLRAEISETRRLMSTPIGVAGSTFDRLIGGGSSLGKAAGHLQNVRRELDLVRRDVSRTFRDMSAGRVAGGAGVGAMFGSMAAGIGQVGREAGKAAGAIGKTAGAGLRAAVGGLVGAMGGPAGVALAGIAVGISAFASKVQDAKNRVAEFRATLDTGGSATFETFTLGAEKASKSFGFFGAGLKEMNDNAYDVAMKIGVSSDTMARAYAGQKDAVDEVTAAAKRYNMEMFKAGQPESSGVGRVTQEIKKAAEEYEKAQKQQAAFAEGLGVTTNQANAMASAWLGFQQAADSGMLSGNQLLVTLDTLTGGTLAASDAAYNYQSQLANTGAAIAQWGKAHAGNMREVQRGLFNARGEFDMTNKSTRDLYAILRQQVEPAFSQVADVYNRFGGGTEGLQKARDVMQGIRDDMFQQLTSVEGMSADTANKVLDNLNIDPDAIELMLDDNNVQSTLEDILNQLRKLNGEDIADIKLNVDADSAEYKLSDIRSSLQMLSQDSDTVVQITLSDGQVIEKMGRIDSAAEQLAAKDVLVTLAGQDNVTGIAMHAKNLLENGFDNKQYQAVLTALDNASGLAGSARDQIFASFVRGDYKASLEAVNNATGVSDQVKAQLQEAMGREYKAQLEAVDNASPEAQKLKEALDALPPEIKTKIGVDADTGKLDEVKQKADQLEPPTLKKVEVQSDTSGLDKTKNDIAGIINMPGVKEFFVQSDSSSLSDTRGQMMSIINMPGTKQMTVVAETTGQGQVMQLQSDINQLQDKHVNAVATAQGRPGVEGLKGSVKSLQGKQVNAVATAKGKPGVDSLKGSVRTLTGKRVDAVANPKGRPGVEQLKSSVRTMQGKKVDAVANPKGEPGVKSLKRSITSLSGKQVNVHATATGHGGVNALRNAIARVQSKVVRITSVFSKVFNSDGNIFEPTRFADGGIVHPMSGVRDPRVKFAELHTAQIAPAGAYRVWAEQETGGEAYIPLALAKRSRSESILAEVAHRFGGEFVKYANGDSGTGSLRAPSAGGDTYNVTVNSVDSNVAGEVGTEVMSSIRHLRRGGFVGS